MVDKDLANQCQRMDICCCLNLMVAFLLALPVSDFVVFRRFIVFFQTTTKSLCPSLQLTPSTSSLSAIMRGTSYRLCSLESPLLHSHKLSTQRRKLITIQIILANLGSQSGHVIVVGIVVIFLLWSSPLIRFGGWTLT